MVDAAHVREEPAGGRMRRELPPLAGAAPRTVQASEPATLRDAHRLYQRSQGWFGAGFVDNHWHQGTQFDDASAEAMRAMLRKHGWTPAPPKGAGEWWAHPARGTVPFVVALRGTLGALAGQLTLQGVQALPAETLNGRRARPAPPETTAEKHARAERARLEAERTYGRARVSTDDPREGEGG